LLSASQEQTEPEPEVGPDKSVHWCECDLLSAPDTSTHPPCSRDAPVFCVYREMLK